MEYVPYVGFATHRRATVIIHLYFKRLMFMKMICIKRRRRKKKKKRVVTVFFFGNFVHMNDGFLTLRLCFNDYIQFC